MNEVPSLDQIRQLVVENCMLKVDPALIQDETVLFDPVSGLGLDSIDALQLAVAIEGICGIPLKDPQLARQILRSPATIRQWIERSREAA